MYKKMLILFGYIATTVFLRYRSGLAALAMKQAHGFNTPVGTSTMHALRMLDTRLVLSAEAVATRMTSIRINMR